MRHAGGRRACLRAIARVVGREHPHAHLLGAGAHRLGRRSRVADRGIERQRIDDDQTPDRVGLFARHHQGKGTAEAVADHDRIVQVAFGDVREQAVAHLGQERFGFGRRQARETGQLHEMALDRVGLQRDAGLAPGVGAAVEAGNHDHGSALADHLDGQAAEIRAGRTTDDGRHQEGACDEGEDATMHHGCMVHG